MKSRKSSIYLTWPFYLSLALLMVNDHVFKYVFPGLLSGKLSDFAGIFLSVLVLRSLSSKPAVFISGAVFVGFVWWKSAYSQVVIDWVNHYSPLIFVRTIDYSDLCAVLMIPIANLVYDDRQRYIIGGKLIKLLKIPVIGVTAMAIMGTSAARPPHHIYEIRKTDVEQNIDIPKAVLIIQRVAGMNRLDCVSCAPYQRKGVFQNDDIKLNYHILPNERGVAFDIVGKPTGIIVGNGSWAEMNRIKRHLKNAFAEGFGAMELVFNNNPY